MTKASHDLMVLGGGPGGYVAAIRAAQLGLDTAVIDDHPRLGGTCLRVGCIPSKALLESSHLLAEARDHFAQHGIQVGDVQVDLAAMLHRKDQIVDTLTGGINMLLQRAKVTVYHGRGRLERGARISVEGQGGGSYSAKHIVIATGSRPATIPGIEIDNDLIGDSTTALSYPQVPQRLVVIGGGYIGLELGSVWKRLGAEVIVLEALDRILPGVDIEIGQVAHRSFQKQGLELRTGTRVESIEKNGNGCVVHVRGADSINCDRVLLATGRVANTAEIGLEDLDVAVDDRGVIQVDEDYATNVPGVYAIGDCIGGAMLAHKASEEGIACVEKIATGYGHVNYEAIPAVVYTHPEIATVGRTEEQLQEAGIEYRKGVCPYGANGRARTLGDTDGRVKILADARTDRVLGVHIIGNRAGDLIAEAAAAMSFGASSEDVARVCHAHPTLSEMMMEAALSVHRRAIHT